MINVHCVTHAESVGGAVTMKVNKTVATDFEVWAVWLQCSVERGTFPEYSWYLNNTRLEEPDLFLHQTNNEVYQVILVPETAGLYHCEAANAFDSTTRVLSQKWLINKEGKVGAHSYNLTPKDTIKVDYYSTLLKPKLSPSLNLKRIPNWDPGLTCIIRPLPSTSGL